MLAQLLGYMADIKKSIAKEKSVKGIVIAYDFSNRLIAATSLLENVSIMRYKAKFNFEKLSRNHYLPQKRLFTKHKRY